MDDDESFKKWFDRLKSSTQGFSLVENINNELDPSELLKHIQSQLKEESSQFPDWAEDIPAGRLVSTDEELRHTLRHIALPHAIEAYKQIIELVKNEYKELSAPTDGEDEMADDSDSVKVAKDSQLVPFQIAPLSTDKKDMKQIMTTFLSSLSSNETGSLVRLCMLADINHRLSRASVHDSALLRLSREDEEERRSSSVIAVSQARDRLEVLNVYNDQSESSALRACEVALDFELKERNKVLQEAEKEEDQARRVYEAAIAKRKKAAAKVDTIDSLLSTTVTQRKTLQNVTSRRLELETYNMTCASKRIELFNQLDIHIQAIKVKLLGVKIKEDVQTMFEQLVMVFKSSFLEIEDKSFTRTQIAERDIQMFLAAQIGLETIRLWRQMSPVHVIDVMKDTLCAFEITLRSILNSLPLPSSEDSIHTSGVSRHDDSTVVLYFDHIFHDTPRAHVENQDRVKTSMDALKAILHMTSQVNVSDSKPLSNPSRSQNVKDVDTDTSSNKRQTRRSRAIQMIKCNDILSPPLWAIPLVHSPQYIAHLWELSQEARRDDLLVPLEFDTEWESDMGKNEDTDEDLPPGNKANTRLKRSLILPSSVALSVGPENASQYSKLLTPIYGDEIIAKALHQHDKDRSRGRDQGTPVGDKNRSRREVASLANENYSRVKSSSVSSPSPSKQSRPAESTGDELVVGCRVSTPYGRGVVRSLGPNNSDPVVVDFTGYKATGYLSKVVVEVIPCVPVIPDLPPELIASILVEERNNVLENEFKDGRVHLKSIVLSDNRFKFTHPFLHRILTRFVKIVKIQKRVADAAKLNTATLSLWVHGRCSRGLSRTIQDTFLQYVKYFDEYDALKFLDDYVRFDDDSTVESSEDNDDEEKVEANVPTETTVARLPSSSSKHVTFDGPRGHDDDDDDDDDENNSIASSSKLPVTRRGPIPTIASVTLTTSATGSVIPNTEEDDLVRLLLKKAMKLTNTSQTDVANYFRDVYGEHSSQGKLSGWFLYKLREPTNSTHRRSSLKWIRENAARLPPKDEETLTRLESWEKTLHLPEPTRRRRNSSSPNKAPTTINSSSSNNNNNNNNNNSHNSSVQAHRLLTFAQDTAEKKDPSERMDDDGNMEETASCSGHESETGNDMMNVDSQDEVFISETNAGVLSKTSLSEDMETMTPPAEPLEVEKKTPFSELEEFTEENIDQEVAIRLRDSIRAEITRRRIAVGIVNSEAKLQLWGRGLEAVQAFLLTASLEVTEQALEFYNLLLKWLRESVKKKNFHSISASLAHRYTSSSSKPTTAILPKKTTDVAERYDDLSPHPVLADSFAPGFHYHSCEHCHTGNEAIPCSLCPCRYHAKCVLGDESVRDLEDKSKWICPKCMENRLPEAVEVTADDKVDLKPWKDRWVLIYSSALRRWRPGIVTSTCSLEKFVTQTDGTVLSQPQYLVLVKWWRTDNRGGKSSWMNITRARVLQMSPPPGSKNLKLGGTSRRSASSVSNEDGSDEMKQIKRRRVQSVSTFLDTDEGTSTIPRSQFLSTDGVGGSSALYGNDKDQLNSSSSSRAMKEKKEKKGPSIVEEGSADTYICSESVQSALCAAGIACKAVDVVMCSKNTNAFACIRPPGHHAGRHGCTRGCLSTGFCLLNNAAFASVYARVRWGLERVAVIDIDVHFGNGTAELLRGDPRSFFASVHMIYGPENAGISHPEGSVDPNLDMHTELPTATANGFYPAELGHTEIEDNYVSVGVYPAYAAEKKGTRRRPVTVLPKKPKDEDSSSDEEDNNIDGNQKSAKVEMISDHADNDEGDLEIKYELTSTHKSTNLNRNRKKKIDRAAPVIEPLFGVEGYRRALTEHILPRMEAFRPQLLIISAGFDGFHTDPLGGDLGLSLEDYVWSTQQLMASMERISGPGESRIISLLEGGYDVEADTLGLARCVVAHVKAMRDDASN